jgi:hypothetical protein
MTTTAPPCAERPPPAVVQMEYRAPTARVQRFIDKGFLVPGAADDCWHWRGNLDKDNYAISGGPAYRVIWTATNGPVTTGWHLDHVCHSTDITCPGGDACMHRRCVNPRHLEPVTPLENNRRAAHRRACQRASRPRPVRPRRPPRAQCSAGHAFDDANTLRNRRGGRVCRRCNNRRTLLYRSRARLAAHLVRQAASSESAMEVLNRPLTLTLNSQRAALLALASDAPSLGDFMPVTYSGAYLGSITSGIADRHVAVCMNSSCKTPVASETTRSLAVTSLRTHWQSTHNLETS